MPDPDLRSWGRSELSVNRDPEWDPIKKLVNLGLLSPEEVGIAPSAPTPTSIMFVTLEFVTRSARRDALQRAYMEQIRVEVLEDRRIRVPVEHLGHFVRFGGKRID